ncbi:MAG TPA: squalene--hopene cyclase [Candidatus Baltobacteraceae bacterium]|jgi:squalene-hopene/tetraprenyl-beta-curcumene cyclase|nr:squalene--hopene cyclase [Candidatus Baltobacteraceae bacterium]
MQDHLDRAVAWLLDKQHPDGWWTDELETNVTMTAEHVLLLRFLGISPDPIREGAIEHILHHQRSDGSWALYYDGPADLSTTIEAYVALKVLGVDPARGEMQRALEIVRKLGGLASARVFTKIWMALFGVYPWDGIPTMPPEIVYFPPWMPFNLYDFSCWARGTVAPLCVVIARRPVRPLGVTVDEIINPGTHARMHAVPGSGWLWWVDKGLKLYERLPWKPGRESACRAMIDWIVERQEADGSWGGIQPPWVYSLIALNLEGHGVDSPVLRKGLHGMERFAFEDETGWRFQACMSPVWDTAWALRALYQAGLRHDHPALQRAVAWMLAEQIDPKAPGDWRVRCKNVDNGGWAFEFDNDAYPDIDDTAVIVCSLLETGEPATVHEPIERAVRWTLAMRSSNNAWAAFDRDNTSEILYRMPFSDFGAMIDPPSEDVTAHVVEMLAMLGRDESDPYVAGALAYLRKTQRPWGSWFGRWGVNHIYGTWCVVSALGQMNAGRDMILRAVQWMISRQNADGGWGESCHSYVDESFAGVGASTPSQTAWAVMTMQWAGMGNHPAAVRGLGFLRETQRTDGTWDEPHFTGTGFPRDFYLNYHLYRHLFPTMALAMEQAPLRAQMQVRDTARQQVTA